MDYAKAFWPEGKGSAESESDAELLIGLITDADHQGQAKQLADTYAASQLKKVSMMR